MTEIDDLIRQAKEVQRGWRKPKPHDFKPPRARSWREILQNRKAASRM